IRRILGGVLLCLFVAPVGHELDRGCQQLALLGGVRSGIQTLGLKLSNESVRLLPCRGVTGDDLLVARGSNREPISALRPYLDGAMRLIQREEGSGSAALPRLGVAIRHGETRLARL